MTLVGSWIFLTVKIIFHLYKKIQKITYYRNYFTKKNTYL